MHIDFYYFNFNFNFILTLIITLTLTLTLYLALFTVALLVEKVKHGDEAMLAKQELYWQYQLRSFRENGGNAMNIKDDLV